MANVCVITGGGSGMGLEAAKFMPKDKIIVLSGRTVSKLENASARYNFSRGMLFSRAYTITGTEEPMPWLPLPELMITGISQPSIRASEAAAA